MNTTHQAVEAAEREKLMNAIDNYAQNYELVGETTKRKMRSELEAAITQEVAAEVDELRQRHLDLLQNVLDAKDVMRAAGIGQCDFPTMFKEFAASRSPAQAGVADTAGVHIHTFNFQARWEAECDAADALLRMLGCDPERSRDEHGDIRLDLVRDSVRTLREDSPAEVAGGVDASRLRDVLSNLLSALTFSEIAHCTQFDQRPKAAKQLRDAQEAAQHLLCELEGDATQAQPSPHPAVGGSGGEPVAHVVNWPDGSVELMFPHALTSDDLSRCDVVPLYLHPAPKQGVGDVGAVK